ncbi:hypothetical protein C5167_006672 [Papaver somniferum]|uniref:Uncharacterized protein n=1 Tax=Papaver somniferum TaxID=3469 RepID=A0A4Y7JHU4_PAPSO|nr:hypothetical protein C5167_006672 [Papaver somniferum]
MKELDFTANLLPEWKDIRHSENPFTGTSKGGIPRFMLIACLAKIEILNGIEVRILEGKESEIREFKLTKILL